MQIAIRMQANEHDDELQRLVTDLAKFRYLLRKFLRFSEKAARDAGLTPQQHQLMLGVAGFNGSGTASVSELAEFLQERHHSVVGLIDRAVAKELVQRVVDSSDRRVVRISLTRQGKSILKRLSLVHQAEVSQLRKGLSQFAGGAMSQTAEEQTEALTPES